MSIHLSPGASVDLDIQRQDARGVRCVVGITQYRLAKTIGVPQIRIHDIVHCRRSITADTALRIGRALGMTPDYWLNLQRMYDLDVARDKTDLSAIEPLVEASA